jgi:hypothetical protein
MTRSQKRINIVLFYILLVVGFIGVTYFITRPEITCTDGIKNQGEEKIDCGGPCSPCKKQLQVKSLKVNSIERVNDGKGTEDLLIEIYNPNEEYGAKSFDYEIYDGIADGNAHNYKGRSFILPKETKYIIVNKYTAQNNGGKITMLIDEGNTDWKKITNFRDPNLIVYNNKYTLETSGGAYSDLTGLLVNKSVVDYELIKIKGILRNTQGELVSASYQTMNTLPSGNKREFHIIFPMKFSGEPMTKEIQVETNIFDSENYLKTRGQQDKWDQ